MSTHTTNEADHNTSVLPFPAYAGDDRTDEDILIQHGYDPTRFRVKYSTSNHWTTATSEGVVWNHQDKVQVEPIGIEGFDFEEQITAYLEDVKPRALPATNPPKNKKTYYVVGLFDLHFGHMTYDDYRDYAQKITDTMAIGHKEIVLICGGDNLNENDYQGHTANLTPIGETPHYHTGSAWQDYLLFLEELVETARKHARSVRVIYVPGNHDESYGHTALMTLKRLYRNEKGVSVDAEQEVFKAFMVGHNFIGATHGHKGKVRDFPMLFATNFASLWGKDGVTTRDLYTGHLHHEVVRDSGGLTHRQCATPATPDRWHEDSGFTTAHNRGISAVYSEYAVEMIRYL